MTRILCAAVMLAMASNAFAQVPAPTFELPPPTGKLTIGTTRWVVTDSSRDELFAPGKKREIEVIAWYPSASSEGQPAPYIRDGMEEVLSFARLAKLGDAFNGLANVKTHARLDAPPMAGRFPVIVFQHGYTGLPSSHTALIEELASHGWAVLNVIHPYESTGAMLADGTVVTFTDENNAMRAGIMDVLNVWGPEGGTMEKIVAAPARATSTIAARHRSITAST